MAKRNRAREAQKLAQQASQQAHASTNSTTTSTGGRGRLMDGVVEVISSPEQAQSLADAVANPQRDTVLSIAAIPSSPPAQVRTKHFDAAQWARQINSFRNWRNIVDVGQCIADDGVRFIALAGEDAIAAFRSRINSFGEIPYVGACTIVCYPAGSDWIGEKLDIRFTVDADKVKNVLLSSCYDADKAYGRMMTASIAHTPEVETGVVNRLPFEGRVTGKELSPTTVMVETPDSEKRVALLDVKKLLPGLNLNASDVVHPAMMVSGEMTADNNEVVSLDGLRQLDDMMAFVRKSASAEGGIVVAGRRHQHPVLISDLGGCVQQGPGLVDPTVGEGFSVEVLPGMVLAVNADEDDPDYVHVRVTTLGEPGCTDAPLRAEMVSKKDVVSQATTLSFFDGGPSWLESLRAAHFRNSQRGSDSLFDDEWSGTGGAFPADEVAYSAEPDTRVTTEEESFFAADAEREQNDRLLVEALLSPEPHDLITALEEAADCLRSAFTRLEEDNENLSTELEKASQSSGREDSGLRTALNAQISRSLKAESDVKALQDTLTATLRKKKELEDKVNQLRLLNQQRSEQFEELSNKLMNLVDSHGRVDASQLQETVKDSAARGSKARENARSSTYGGRLVEIKGTELADPLEQLRFELRLAHTLEFSQEERDQFPLDQSRFVFGKDFLASMDKVRAVNRDRVVRVLLWVVTGRSRTQQFNGTDKNFAQRSTSEERRVYLQRHAAGGRRLHYLLTRDQRVELLAFGLHDDFNDKS